jgi:hypothetical protein
MGAQDFSTNKVDPGTLAIIHRCWKKPGSKKIVFEEW